MIVEFQERRAEEAMEGRDGMDADEAALERADAEGLVKGAKDAIVAFKKLYDNGWENIDNRALGHVRFSPSIKPGAGSNKYTRDYALVEIDSSKMNTANNVSQPQEPPHLQKPDQLPLQGPGYCPRRRDALSYHLGPERRSVPHCHEARQYHWSDHRPR